jgi:hypothetical protein
VRLGTCIALELCVVAGAVAGVWVGVGKAVELAGTYTSEASAATGSAPRIAPLPSAELHVAAPAGVPTVFDAPDDVLLAPIAAAPLSRVKVNHGGTSLSLRLDFANGSRAAFKPQQTHPQSDPRKEIAAYRIDRLLGIGHVAPAKPGTFKLDEMVAATDEDVRAYTAGRLASEAIAKDGVVHGELSWWIPEIRDQTIGPWRVDEDQGMALWTSWLHPKVQIPAEDKPLVEQLVTCVLFDVLIDNADRWTGYNTKGSPDKQTLYFMDNTLSFSLFTFGHKTNLDALFKIEVFPRRLVERLRALTPAMVEAALDVGDDPLAPLLTRPEIAAMLGRRDHLLQYIDGLIAQYGEANVLALP